MNYRITFKFVLCVFLAAAPVMAWCTDRPQDSDLKITIDFHNQMVINSFIDKSKNPTELKNDNADPDPHFFIFLENVSSKPVVIRSDRICLYLYFEITPLNGKIYKVTPVVRSESTPLIRYLLLSPKETTAVQIRYSISDDDDNDVGKYYFIFPPPGKKENVTIRAVLHYDPIAMLKNHDLAMTPEQKKIGLLNTIKEESKYLEKQGIWTGTAKSGNYRVILSGSDK